MKIHFKSTYGQDGDKNVIEFYSPLEKSEQDGFTILDFEQKTESNKIIKNRIEYNKDEVRIYSSISTLVLEKNKVVKNLFKVEDSPVDLYIYTLLHNIDEFENGAKFNYQIGTNDQMDASNEFELVLTFID